MASKTRVTVYYGPLSGFNELLGDGEKTGLLKTVHEMDEATRRHTLRVEGQPDPPPPEPLPRPDRLVAESSDYATLNDHAITNFSGLIRRINPKQLYLHNPPSQVHAQIAQVFEVAVSRFDYPNVDFTALRKLNQEFSQKVIGQTQARDALLASLYPLAAMTRKKPVVLMFYGPSGVGKTESAYLLNGILGGTLLRKQLSMYQNDRFSSYLFGGTHVESSFARDLLDRESGIILLDEFDKANAVFHSAFYQLFDDGHFEDKNYKVEVGPSVIICTSNYQSEKEIINTLGEALYSRFDSLIKYSALSPTDVMIVIDRLVDARAGLLTAQEQEYVKPEELRTLLKVQAAKLGNVRKLGKLIDEAISRRLVRGFLEQVVPEADPSARDS